MTGTTRVGFVGLGNIGKPMALRLAGAEGIDLCVYDVAREPLVELESAGADIAESVAALAARSEVVCVMVRDDDQVRDVLGGILGSAADGLTVVIHSTVAPGTPAALADTAARHGIRVVDAVTCAGPWQNLRIPWGWGPGPVIWFVSVVGVRIRSKTRDGGRRKTGPGLSRNVDQRNCRCR